MRTIHKFLVPFASEAAAELPPCPISPSDKVRHVGIDPRSGQPAIWVEVETQKAETPKGRRFVVSGTGCEVPPGHQHVGSTIDGSFVWHVFEAPST